jgi:hypothetical protein
MTGEGGIKFRFEDREFKFVQQNLLPGLSVGTQSKVRAGLDDAGCQLRELAQDARTNGVFDDAAFLKQSRAGRLTLLGTEKKLGLTVLELLQKGLCYFKLSGWHNSRRVHRLYEEA